jgi:hypothetical protein
MNHEAILALLGDLRAQIGIQQQVIEQQQAQIEKQAAATAANVPEPA